MGQYIIQLSEHYIDSATKKLAINPNVAAHKKDYDKKVFTTPDEPLAICSSLRHIDGTIGFVINQETGGQMVFNSYSEEIEEISIDDLDDICDLDLDVEDESDEELGFPYTGTGF
jgi:hypothetical protein